MDVYAFAIASSGKRCSQETEEPQNGERAKEYRCRTLEVVVQRISDYRETDPCVSVSGVDRNSVGISSDAILEPQFTAKFCSPACYHECRNIINFYFNHAAGEGLLMISFYSLLCAINLISHLIDPERRKGNSNSPESIGPKSPYKRTLWTQEQDHGRPNNGRIYGHTYMYDQ